MPVLDALRTETPRPRVVREHRYAGRLAVTTVSAGAFLGQFDAGIVIFSLPELRRHFDASPAAVQWVSVGYLLTMATAVIPMSRLAGAVGHKLMWTYGFVVVTAASAACGLAPSLGALIAFRVAQAAGAAMIQAGGAALISASVLREKPPAAMGVLRAAQILGLTAGPAAGGLLIATAGWRWVFLVNVPVGCVCVMAARYLLPRTRERTTAQPFGAPGMLFPALFLLTLLLLVSRVSGLSMPSAESVSLAVVCVASALCVRWWVRRARRAVEPASAARARTGIAFPGVVAGQFVLVAPLVLLPQLCAADGVRPATAGMITAALPAGFALAALATPAHRLLRRTGDRLRGVVAAAGCVAATTGIAADPTPGAVVAVLLTVFGSCSGVLVITQSATALPPVTEGRPRTGGTLTAASRELGMALSVAIVTLCLHVAGPAPATTASGPAGARLTLAMLDLSALLLAALIAAGPLLVRKPRKPSVQATAAETPPDARFLLANERTFLAWNRTALALVAAGLATVQLLHPFPGVPWGRQLLAVPLILLGAVIATIGYLELRRNQRALRRAEPLPQSILPKVLTLAVTMIAVISAAVVVISAARGQ